MHPKVKIVSGPKSWIEGAAIAQLERIANYPHMESVIGMPDLHPGPGIALGAVFITTDHIYPHLVGSDIGCGMAVYRTSARMGKPERVAKKLKGLERGVDNPERYEARCAPTGFESSLGTVGRGNHFAEFLVPDGIVEPDLYTAFAGEAESLLLVHSGSRGYGEKILFDHTARFHDSGISVDDVYEYDAYVKAHDHAMRFAYVNRQCIAERILDMIDAAGTLIKDVPHNFLEGCINSVSLTATPTEPGKITGVTRQFFHRKGAIPSNAGMVIIPGSRGSHSYLVQPLGNDKDTGYSLSHGAGRKMSRRDARVKFNEERDSIKKLQRTKFNSVVICEDRELLMEEASEAYKGIDRVVQDLVDHDLVKVVAMLRPAITYKYRRGHDDHEC